MTTSIQQRTEIELKSVYALLTLFRAIVSASIQKFVFNEVAATRSTDSQYRYTFCQENTLNSNNLHTGQSSRFTTINAQIRQFKRSKKGICCQRLSVRIADTVTALKFT